MLPHQVDLALGYSRDTPPAAPQRSTEGMGSLLAPEDASKPLGIQICQALDAIFEAFQMPEESALNGEDALAWCCEEAQKPTSPELLKNSVFGLMTPQEIKEFLLAPDQKMFVEIRQNTEKFLEELLEEPGIRAPSAAKVLWHLLGTVFALLPICWFV